MAVCEADIDQQRRKGHEEAVRAMACPGKKGPTMFMWTDDDKTGFLSCTKVPRGEVQNFWEDFTNSQRRFNSFENEWDLCVEFDPAAHTDEAIEQDMEYFGEVPGPIDIPSRPQPLPLPEDHWRNDIIQTFAPNNEPTVRSDVTKDPLDDYMYFRFRFTCPPIEQSSKPSPREWEEIRLILADSTSPVDKSHQAAITDFVRILLVSRTPSPGSWDLNNPEASLLQEWRRHHCVQVETYSEETFYIVQPHFSGPSECWIFATQSATAVLQCLR